MICPNCNKEMKDKSYWYYGIGSWDADYPDCYHEEHTCKTCKISYINGEWHIPSELVATDKQIKAAEFINSVLKNELPAPTKRNLWKYIHDNLETAKEVRENNFEEWCYENSDWLPEYF